MPWCEGSLETACNIRHDTSTIFIRDGEAAMTNNSYDLSPSSVQTAHITNTNEGSQGIYFSHSEFIGSSAPGTKMGFTYRNRSCSRYRSNRPRSKTQDWLRRNMPKHDRNFDRSRSHSHSRGRFNDRSQRDSFGRRQWCYMCRDTSHGPDSHKPKERRNFLHHYPQARAFMVDLMVQRSTTPVVTL